MYAFFMRPHNLCLRTTVIITFSFGNKNNKTRILCKLDRNVGVEKNNNTDSSYVAVRTKFVRILNGKRKCHFATQAEVNKVRKED